MTTEMILTNARLVLEDRILSGSLVVRDGVIAEIDEGKSASGVDMDGDYILPGLVELHTDHLESHYSPRPGVRWNAISAIQSHDAQIASSGITTVFDCLRLGSDEDDGFKMGEMRAIADALAEARSENRLRADHLIHLRCEVSASDVLEHFADFATDGQVRLASLMDHAPGQRQFQTMEQYTLYYKTKRGLSDEAFAHFVQRRQDASARYSDAHRKVLASACAERGITVASHDDATLDHVAEAVGFGVRLAEFPTSIEAAQASHKAGMSVLMGAPNVVRGGSHSGNIAAADLARAGVLDVLSSDYVPFSLIQAPFVLADEIDELDLATAIRLVTSTPAKTVGLDDRGSLTTGKRADLVRVRRDSGIPVVREVWRQGQRVA
ncbi:MAG: alpha-D-ribose 1-methylphosphonate 5-triphosphate diphosphatase [Hoeflea sp.]|uniref:alpha-D-ribose 1-methylphosphonate 5-triphosphate diphosphatase n=1 Tax=Hoeflea sp. TaxID=1940281 RepID=UPI001DA0485A|nr:alpha-D-ribose 1-methylphosphonate 5-triphosphate diphosphatase [Hoeflea sp.]MBU4528772.1 alpha-D-ribose 1-methylphosphonate 5-triphosphate diphosphatase [Alphaproteobacteria bacterium]MBU4545901.1 alpha-D-ribose 1-methylphosphonate 5-triphosphate diphosphatase [Alphaproteobacteria bacterium]MBU4549906.1 alpha-D-ribose 1-methylphosphonate 5-triphosphate diphosphatase [Alphaproteobacteria bacterium]MBV1725903.1 alpha-D-ribose 1-methylphosphonate 5-triphosphate diphosphatase [Hoeflea sp.]MBV1